MKKGGINIIGYIEQNFGINKPKPVSYTNNDDFELGYSEEDEIRMGLWASGVQIFKNQKNISSELLPKNFLVTIPNQYDAFSRSGKYCFIPTCPILNLPFFIVNTSNLSKHKLNRHGDLMGNQFAPCGEKVLINEYNQFFVYDCETNSSTEIKLPYAPNKIEFAHWIDANNIRLIISSETEKIQRVLNYNLNTQEFESFEIFSPSEVFKFETEPFKEIIESDTFCLFNVKGYVSASVGKILNQWIFLSYDKETEIYKFRTHTPVSGIYKNKHWKWEGIDTLQQDVEYKYDESGITGERDIIANGYKEVKSNNQQLRSKLNFWSKIKSIWS